MEIRPKLDSAWQGLRSPVLRATALVLSIGAACPITLPAQTTPAEPVADTRTGLEYPELFDRGPLFPRAAMERSPAWRQRMMTFLQIRELERKSVVSGGQVAVHRTHPNLDLAHNLEKHARHLGAPDIPLAPPMVVGEGADPENGTVVRILNAYQVTRDQFSAFDPAVKGGVHVAAFRHGGRIRIAATPITDASPAGRAVRIFDTNGIVIRTIVPPAYLRAPFVIATGQFESRTAGGDERIAVASRDQAGNATRILIYDGTGQLAKGVSIPRPGGSGGTLELNPFSDPERDKLLLNFQPGTRLAVVDTSGSGAPRVWRPALPQLDPIAVAGQSAFDGQLFLAARNSERFLSLANRVAANLATAEFNAGYKENLFYSHAVPFDSTRTRFVQRGRRIGGETRPNVWTVWNSDRVRNAGALRSKDPDVWMAGVQGLVPLRDTAFTLYPYWTMWLYNWGSVRLYEFLENDPEFGLCASFMELDAELKPAGDGSTAKGDVDADRNILLTSRVILWLSARAFLSDPANHDPELTFGATSLHELSSRLDYSPTNVRSWREFLKARFGTVATLNAVYGTPFAETADFSSVDPPRNRGRGAWDVPTIIDKWGNVLSRSPFGDEFLDFCRFVNAPNRHVDAFRDVLLAGFPPELVKNHRPNAGDQHAWLTSGTSTGLSVYLAITEEAERRRFFRVPNSGFRNLIFGESPADSRGLPIDPLQLYTQLRFYWQHGAKQINGTSLIPGYDLRNIAEAERMIAAEDRPRPGLTGGIAQIRSFRQAAFDGTRRSDVVVVGTGRGRQGLIKSLGPDGRWDGRVYVMPFHAKVETRTVNATDVTGGKNFGPIDRLDHNEQIEVSFVASGTGSVRLSTRHGDIVPGRTEAIELPDSVHVFQVSSTPRRYRYVLRNQLALRRPAVQLRTTGSVVLSDVHAISCHELAARPGVPDAAIRAHSGAVTFDFLDRDVAPVRSTTLSGATSEGFIGDVSGPIAGETSPDTAAPVWPQAAAVRVLMPFQGNDGRPPALSTLGVEPVYAVRLVPPTATDNDVISRYEVWDGTNQLETTSEDGVLTLPPLEPLVTKALSIRAVDRAGNRSAPLTVTFTTPAVFDFGASNWTGTTPYARRVSRATVYSAATGFGWSDPTPVRESGYHAGGSGPLGSYAEAAVSPAEFRVDLPGGGAFHCTAVMASWYNASVESYSLRLNGAPLLGGRVAARNFQFEPFTAVPSEGHIRLGLDPGSKITLLVVYPARGRAAMPPWSANLTATDRGYVPNPGPFGGVGASTFSWQPASGAVRYRVHVNDVVVTSTNVTSVRIEGLPTGVPLSVRVQAVDADGNAAWSPILNVPAIPGTLAAGFWLASSFTYNDGGGNPMRVHVNGDFASEQSSWREVDFKTVNWAFSPGVNTIAVYSAGAIHSKLQGYLFHDGARFAVGPRWKVAFDGPPGWTEPAFNDAAWTQAFYMPPYSSYGGLIAAGTNPRTWITATVPELLVERRRPLFFRHRFVADRPRSATFGGPAALTATDQKLRSLLLTGFDQDGVPALDALSALSAAVKAADPGGTGVRFEIDDPGGAFASRRIHLRALVQTSSGQPVPTVRPWTLLREIAHQAGALVEILPDGIVRFAPVDALLQTALATGRTRGSAVPAFAFDVSTGRRFFTFTRNPQAFEATFDIERFHEPEWQSIARRTPDGQWSTAEGFTVTETPDAPTGLVIVRIDSSFDDPSPLRVSVRSDFATSPNDASLAFNQPLIVSDLLRDNAVLQRDRPIPVRGYANRGETVRVAFGNQTRQTTASFSDGSWEVIMPPSPATTLPRELTIDGATSRVVVRNLVVGDVWVGSGQSNMGGSPLAADIAGVNDPSLRVMTIADSTWGNPVADPLVGIPWRPATTSGNLTNISPVMFHMAETLRALRPDVPIGIIVAAVGGTGIDHWVPYTAEESDPVLRSVAGNLTAQTTAWRTALAAALPAMPARERSAMLARQALADGVNVQRVRDLNTAGFPGLPGGRFNGMIAPLQRMPVAGVVWYQGEANASELERYQNRLTALITRWRAGWRDPELPFLLVQLPNFADREPGFAPAREAQRRTAAALPRVWHSVNIDIGRADDLHPPDKQPFGRRLALLVREHIWRDGTPGTSPSLLDARREGSAVIVSLGNVAGAIFAGRQTGRTPAAPVPGSVVGAFQIAGTDGVFVTANATLESSNIRLSAAGVPAPEHVRYAWSADPSGPLIYGGSGLPLTPFALRLRTLGSVVSPAASQELDADGVVFRVDAADPRGIALIEFFVNGVLVAESRAPVATERFEGVWKQPAGGDYTLTVRVTTSGGAATMLAPVRFSVAPTPPGRATWTNAAGGSWALATNWRDSLPPLDSASVGIRFDALDISGERRVTIDGLRTVGALRFEDIVVSSPGSWRLDAGAGGALRLGASVSTIDVGAMGSEAVVSIGAPVSGTGALRKTGSGTLVLGGENSYTGRTTVASGELELLRPSALSPAVVRIQDSGSLMLRAPGALLSRRFELTGTGTESRRIGVRSGTSGVFSGNVAVASGAGPLILDARDNSAAGATSLVWNGGVMELGNSTLILSGDGSGNGDGGSSIELRGVTVRARGLTYNWSRTAGSAITLNATTVSLTGDLSAASDWSDLILRGTTRVEADRVVRAAATGSLHLERGTVLATRGFEGFHNLGGLYSDGGVVVALPGVRTPFFDRDSALIFLRGGGMTLDTNGMDVILPARVRSHAPADGGLVKTGTGQLTLLSPHNTWNGPTTVRAGTLALSANATLGVSRVLVLEPGATLDVSAVANSTFTLPPGNTLDAAGTLRGNLVSTGGRLAVVSGRTFTVTGSLALAGNLTVSGPAIPGETVLIQGTSRLTGTFESAVLPPAPVGFVRQLAYDGARRRVVLRYSGPGEAWLASRAPGQAWSSDFDRDGWTLLAEYSLGGDPAASDAARIRASTRAGRLRITFPHDTAATDTTVEVQVSSDLREWTTILSRAFGSTAWAGPAVFSRVSGPGTVESLTVEDTGSGPRRFLRVHVTR